IPIWVADYVLMGYGTGAVMGVPGHDDRDNEFAKKYGLEIRQVLKTDKDSDFHSEGVVINSDKYNGMRSEAMREKILEDFVQKGTAKEVINYKIRDWLISRQRYWGAPIPIIHCPRDGAVAVPEDQLPVVLPEVKSYEPSGDGRSPLANVKEFVNTTCPKCGGKAERETDTMDGFACSSWYFLRFAGPHNDKEPFSKDKAKFWLPVDDYIGGAEHAVMHLLYARFWTKVMHDEGLIEFDEPFSKLRNQGMILAPDGNKMSKSKGNTIEPSGLIEQGYGADTIRLMELFIGPWNQAANWSVEGMGGVHRFLQRIWTLVQEFNDSDGGTGESTELKRALHKTIKKASQDLNDMSFNTAIAALMECVNELYRIKAEDNYASTEWQWALESLLQLLAPFAPHISEELWQQLGQEESIHITKWPAYDEQYLTEDSVTIVIQVNGKLRGEIQVDIDATEDAIVEAAKAEDKVSAHLADKTIRKTIYVPGKLVNFVI
ncbi:MAG: leucine--tRNA ligase, partial [Patescibacteria group bacterium]